MTYIDGYNLLLSHYPDLEDIERGREALIDYLRHRKVVLVFDAANTADPCRRMHTGDLEIVYTGPGESADNYIVSEIERTGGCVVTNDRELSTRVKWAGGKAKSAEKFDLNLGDI